MLAVANAQCLARCGTELCDNTPASHCHEDPDAPPVAACAHPQFALSNAAGIEHVTLEAGDNVLPASVTPLALGYTEARAFAADPPGERPLLSVLKI
jgi:hypothetical protein